MIVKFNSYDSMSSSKNLFGKKLFRLEKIIHFNFLDGFISWKKLSADDAVSIYYTVLETDLQVATTTSVRRRNATKNVVRSLHHNTQLWRLRQHRKHFLITEK